ncbi:MAG TPA: hypothetical protein VM759_06365 [Longimicrobium sp.]|nr:hypothetical protein [Longimicrobium sp.]
MTTRAIRLPDRFYLPRIDAEGREVRDVMPWEGAVAYATDGARVGVQYPDGTVAWLGDAPEGLDPSGFEEDFEGVNLEALVAGLHAYVDRHPVLRDVWREDLQRLDSIRAVPDSDPMTAPMEQSGAGGG